MLLNNLGVADDVFLKLLKTELRELSEMFVVEEMARQKMSSVRSINWKQLEVAGMQIISEPYLRSLMMALYRCKVRPCNPNNA